METGIVVVEKVGGKSTAIRCFSHYPLKFIIPNKIGSSHIDSLWIYTLTYGGGIVSGDSISCKISVRHGCTAAFTTQASTKVYKSVGSKCCEQMLEATVGSDALFACMPDPVTCFSTARYSQKQVFRIASDSNLVIVDWVTSGRHASGEKWDFQLYKSTNNIFLDDGQPIFLDTQVLENESDNSIAGKMYGYQVIAMVIIIGPKLKHVQNNFQEGAKKMMSEKLMLVSSAMSINGETYLPDIICSCSVFGKKKMGMLCRIASTSTEMVKKFLGHHLADMVLLLGAIPYS